MDDSKIVDKVVILPIPEQWKHECLSSGSTPGARCQRVGEFVAVLDTPAIRLTVEELAEVGHCWSSCGNPIHIMRAMRHAKRSAEQSEWQEKFGHMTMEEYKKKGRGY